MAIEDELRLGRIPSSDPRDRAFPVTAFLPSQVTLTGKKNWWDIPGWAQQGATGRCVGFNTFNWWVDSPITHPKDSYRLDPAQLYLDAMLVDEWPENDWTDPAQADLEFGTSVRAGLKVLQQMGLIGSYRWPTTFDEIRTWLTSRGSIIVGTNWYDDFWTPVSKKIGSSYHKVIDISASAKVVGGHCFIWNGIDNDNGYIRAKLGSWPRDSYGEDGRVRMSFEVAERLWQEDGEVACVLEPGQ